MAEDKKSRKKITQVEKSEKRTRKKPTLRERNVEAATKKGKTSRVRKAAGSAKSGSKRIGGALTREYHVVTPKKEDPGFFMKSRSLTPRYFRNAWLELKQVQWPGFKTTWKLVFAVFVFAFIIGGFIAVLDHLLEQAFREVIL